MQLFQRLSQYFLTFQQFIQVNDKFMGQIFQTLCTKLIFMFILQFRYHDSNLLICIAREMTFLHWNIPK